MNRPRDICCISMTPNTKNGPQIRMVSFCFFPLYIKALLLLEPESSMRRFSSYTDEIPHTGAPSVSAAKRKKKKKNKRWLSKAKDAAPSQPKLDCTIGHADLRIPPCKVFKQIQRAPQRYIKSMILQQTTASHPQKIKTPIVATLI